MQSSRIRAFGGWMGAVAFFRRMFDIDVGVARIARLRPLPWWASILVGVGCAAAALLARGALDGIYGDAPGFMILLPAVIVAGLAAGRTAGAVAILACLAGCWLVVGLHTPDVGFAQADRVAIASFLIVGLFAAVVAASLRKILGRLAETEDRLRLISEQAPAMLWVGDETGKCVHLNDVQRAFWGAPDNLDLFDFPATLHPDDRDRVLRATRGALERQAPFEVEGRYLRADGVWRVLRTDARPRRDRTGRFVGLIGVNTDITEARAAETALRESEERFRLMADTAPSPVWLTNEEGEVEFANDALVAFYGAPAARIMGHVWKEAIHPDDVADVAAAQAAARPQRKPYAFECRFRRFDGAWRWMRVSVNPRFDGEGRFKGYVGLSFDISETREAIDALARQEQRQSFLLALTDRLRDMDDSDDVMAEVNRTLGERLGASRVGFGELDRDAGVFRHYRDWTRDTPSSEGEWPVDAFGGTVDQELSEGSLVVVEDVATDLRTSSTLQAHLDIAVRAFAAVPLMRAGRLRAFLYVQSPVPRVWTADELGLADEVAERAWVEVERTRAQAEVAESEARFRAIADTAPVLIWVTQQDRTRAFVNQAYVAYDGGAYEEARTADWRAILHPDDQDRVLRESLAGEATREPFSMEARYLRHDGEYRWLKSFSRPRFGPGGAVIGFVGVAFDVTDIREAQARLVESEARFRTVADSAPALIWMTDDQPAIVFANKRYKTFFGVDAEAVLDRGWMGFVYPEDLRVFSLTFLRAFKTRDRFEAVMRIQHPTLGLRWLRSEGVPRFDAAGAFQGYVGASLDITDAKRAEDDLKRINELLEERVGEALAEKAKAEADLMHAQRMEAVGRLTGGVAHDFNNLLTVVIGALDMILKSPDDAARRQKLGEAALAAARRGEGLTHQLLAFSRRQALRPQQVDLNALIREGEPLLRRAVGEAVDFRLKLRRGGARVSVDPAQFEAALLNLIVNARDAVGARPNRKDADRRDNGRGKDGGRITVQTMSCEIEPGEVIELAPGRYVCITVSDNGAGMEPSTMTRVFEPFFTTKAVGKGTGLGLSQVYGFARQSGGGVHISSTIGRGTEIRLYLPPLDPAEAPAVESERIGNDAIPSGRRLLLVEDDTSVAAVAVELLTGLGLEVEAVETGPDALSALSRSRFDVMLSDVVMPGGMTGIELARRCAVDHPALRILLTSGYAGDDVDEALTDAPWPFLRKPYSGDQLRQALGALLPLEPSTA